MKSTLIVNAKLVNEGKIYQSDVLIKGDRIEKISLDLQSTAADTVIDAQGLFLIPGMIDDQVHFREPGLMHKGEIATESAAAVAGGITSYMEMPNVLPATVNEEELEAKFLRAREKSFANYSFYLGATNENIDEIKNVNRSRVCGVKVFMGSSTGSLLVDEPEALDAIFRESPVIIVTHCEDNRTIERNLAIAQKKYGTQVPISQHPIIRDTEACYTSSSYAVGLARKYGTNLHVLHLTTEKELQLFDKGPIDGKKITAEVCVHHLWFCDEDYQRLGNYIKCNPSIKSSKDREALWSGLTDGRIDVIATDHAPHTIEEKSKNYLEAPAGLPLVQHALLSLIESTKMGRISIESVVQKVSHNPAIRFGVKHRGFIREGYHADLVLLNLDNVETSGANSILYKCGWSPFEKDIFGAVIQTTFVNGIKVFDQVEGVIEIAGKELEFDRN